MKRRFGIAGLLAMGLIVVLGAMGIGYGLWQKTLTLDAHVNTGTVNAELSSLPATLSWDNVSNPHPTCGGTEFPPCTFPAATTCGEVLNGDGTMTVTFNNAFPYVCCQAGFDVHNTGTIPITLERPVATQVNGNAGDLTITTCPDLADKLNVPGFSNCWVKLCVNEQAAQNAAYSASVSILTHQYNEAP